MTPVYSSGFAPDPFDARDVLAFILCPLEVFAPRADADEMAVVAEMIGPAKEEALRRWQEADARRQAN